MTASGVKASEKNTKYPPLTPDERARIDARRRQNHRQYFEISKHTQEERDRLAPQWVHADVFGDKDARP